MTPEQVEILKRVRDHKYKTALECGNYIETNGPRDLVKHYEKMSHQARLEAEAIEQALQELGHG